jgi:rubrerythrin
MPRSARAPDEGAEGAPKELARDPSSRRRFLGVVGGAGAAGALSIFLATCGDDDEGTTAATGTGAEGGASSDLEIVNYALKLEYLEAQFYDQVLDADVLQDEKVVSAAESIRKDEQEHVSTLKGAAKKLGGTAAKPPKTDFQKVIDEGEAKVLETAAAIENIGAAAYLGQLERIRGGELLATVLSIHSVEGRHAALLNFVSAKSITPDGAFAKPASQREVLKQIKPFLASGARG